MNKQPGEILKLESKEKFRRFLLISSRVIALLLVFAIFFIGFVQINYVKEVNQIKAEYGSNGYCYLCGIETGKSCNCNYLPELVLMNENFDIKVHLDNIATMNVEKCENINNKNNEKLDIKF
jgi:hypothetical protein